MRRVTVRAENNAVGRSSFPCELVEAGVREAKGRLTHENRNFAVQKPEFRRYIFVVPW